jgi:hypothetical protein
MTFGEAKALLLVNRGDGPALGHRTGRCGSLGRLLPHGGRLDEAYFHHLMAAVVAVAPHLRGEARVDRELVAALWDLCAPAWQWASEPDGSRRQPGCVADAERVVLVGRLEALSSAVSVLLGGGPLEDALASYRRLAGAAERPPPPGA